MAELALTALAATAGETALASGAAATAAAAGTVAGTTAASGAIASGAAAASAAAGTAAAGGGILAALGTSPVLSVLTGASTAVSVLQKLNAGQLNASNAEFEAQGAQNAAIGEQASGAQRATLLKRSLLKTLGENQVAYAASGIDLSYGVAADDAAHQKDLATGELNTDQATTSARIAGYDARSAAYMRQSRAYRTGSILDALATAGLGTAQTIRRGAA